MKYTARPAHALRGCLAALAFGALIVATSCASSGSTGESDDALGGEISALVTPEQNRGLEPLYASFKEETGVEVDAEFTDASSLVEQLRVQLTSGTAPDVFRSSVGRLQVGVQALAPEGYLLDLAGADWLDSVPESFLPLIEHDEGVYAYPASAQGILMFYNKGVFDDLSISAPTTWSEFIDISETIRDAGKVPTALPLAEQAGTQMIPYMLAATLVSSRQEDLYEQMDAGKATFSESDEWREVFEKFFGLIESGLTTPDPLGMPADQAMQAVANGSAAMIAMVSPSLPTLAEYFPGGAGDVGVFALPATENADETWAPFSPELLSVNADSRNPEGAKAFIEYIADPERVTEYANETGAVPALLGVTPVDNPVGQLLTRLNEEGRTSPFSVHRWSSGEVQLAFMQNAQLVVAGDLTIDGLLERMDEAYAAGIQ